MQTACSTVLRKVNLSICIENCAEAFVYREQRAFTLDELRKEVGEDVICNYNSLYVDTLIKRQLSQAQMLVNRIKVKKAFELFEKEISIYKEDFTAAGLQIVVLNNDIYVYAGKYISSTLFIFGSNNLERFFVDLLKALEKIETKSPGRKNLIVLAERYIRSCKNLRDSKQYSELFLSIGWKFIHLRRNNGKPIDHSIGVEWVGAGVQTVPFNTTYNSNCGEKRCIAARSVSELLSVLTHTKAA